MAFIKSFTISVLIYFNGRSKLCDRPDETKVKTGSSASVEVLHLAPGLPLFDNNAIPAKQRRVREEEGNGRAGSWLPLIEKEYF